MVVNLWFLVVLGIETINILMYLFYIKTWFGQVSKIWWLFRICNKDEVRLWTFLIKLFKPIIEGQFNLKL